MARYVGMVQPSYGGVDLGATDSTLIRVVARKNAIKRPIFPAREHLLAQQPDVEILEWAEAVGVQNPGDRPWYLVPAILVNGNGGFPFVAPCTVCEQHGFAVVFAVSAHPADNDTAWIWIGQCPRCQAIYWSYARKEASE